MTVHFEGVALHGLDDRGPFIVLEHGATRALEPHPPALLSHVPSLHRRHCRDIDGPCGVVRYCRSVMEVGAALTEAEELAARGRPHEALDLLLRVIDEPVATAPQVAAARVAAIVTALRMYELQLAHDLLVATEVQSLPEPWRTRARLLEQVVSGLLGDATATDRLVEEVGARLDGPLDASEMRFIAEGLTLAIARTGRRDDLLDVVLRVAGMARDLGIVDLVTALLVAEAAYRSRSDLAGGARVAERAVGLAREDRDHRNLPFALAQAANAHAGLGDAIALDEASELETFGAPAALMVAGLARASHALTTDDHDRAFRLLVELDGRFADARSRVVSWHADLTELAVERGEMEVARRAVDAARDVAELSGMPWLRATADRCAALLATEPREVECLSVRAIDTFEAGGYLISSSRTRLAWARRLRADGDPSWRAVARSAAEGFDRAGMGLWAARCRRS